MSSNITSASSTSNLSKQLLVSDSEVINNSHDTVISNKNVETILNDYTLFHENSITNPLQNNKPILADKLRFIISKYHVSHHFVNELLTILRDEELDVPKDVRTLLRTPKSNSHNILNINPGTYIHFGVHNMLMPIISKFFDELHNTSLLELGCNIDGLPISKSSKACFWPILVSFVNCNIYNLSKIVIPIGIYYHKSKKPSSASEFLTHFISEMKIIIDSGGLRINEKTFQLKISQVVCDAPAKAFILNVKGHNAYHSCNSCIVEGSFINNRMSYLDINCTLRTNESFREKLDEYYHKGDESPLETLDINITNVVVLEYMHNICLGVMKKLLSFWVKGLKPIRLLSVHMDLINSDLIDLGQYLPSEFCRQPRSLDDMEFWKASEFRCFLLYTGPIVLKGRLKKKLYSHFIILHCAIRLLMSDKTCILLNDVANDMLRSFVRMYSILYGEDTINYNVHGLIHIANFVKLHGPLDNFSAFKYENYLGFLKKITKNGSYPLEDIYNRVIEYNRFNNLNTDVTYPILKNEIDYYGPLYGKNLLVTYYDSIILQKFSITCNNLKDNTFLLHSNDVISVKKIIQYPNSSIMLEVIKFHECYPMFNSPIKSTEVGCFYVNVLNVSSYYYLVPLDSISLKCFFVSISNNKAIMFTLLHSM